MSKIAITGGNGFIGSFLAETLSALGHRVICPVRTSSNTRWLDELDVDIVRGDLYDREFLDTHLSDIDYLYHVAARINAPNWESYRKSNVILTQLLAESINSVAPNIKRFLFVSSISAAGPSEKDQFITETDADNPVSDYGRSKLEAEQVLIPFMEKFPVTVVRPPNVIGPKQSELLNAINLIKKRLVPVIGNGDIQTSIIYVKDLVGMMIAAAEHTDAIGKTYFATFPTPYAWGDVTRFIRKELSKEGFAIKIPYAVQYMVAGISEFFASLFKRAPLVSRENVAASRNYYWIYSGDKIKNELGLTAETDLQNAINETITWYRNKGIL